LKFQYFLLLSILLSFTFCQNVENRKQKFKKGDFPIKGVSFVGMNYKNERAYLQKLDSLNITWISQMPYAFQRENDTKIHFEFDKKWWGESDSGIIITTSYAKEFGIKTMLKPQIWMGGTYTGKFYADSEEEWLNWEENYERFILYYAKLAEQNKHEAFCIGTELHQTVLYRPKFWVSLISKIRKIYSGKLTYAANWDEYNQIPFWKKLDFIGVNAYFPLSSEKTPKTKDLIKSWGKYILPMNNLCDSLGKKIVFTEIGYKSVNTCAKEPWNPASQIINYQAQFNAYQAFLHVFSDQKSWFEGYFLWKWYPNKLKTDGEPTSDYTPQGKITEQLLN
jgi:hypothetical protein